MVVSGIMSFIELNGFEDAEAFVVGFVPVLLGAILLTTGCTGFLGTTRDSSNLLILDLLGTITITLMFAVACSGLLAYTAYIVKGGPSITNSTSILNVVDMVVNDYQMALFDECCVSRGFGEFVEPCSEGGTPPCILSVGFYDACRDFFIGPVTCSAVLGIDTISSALAANKTSIEQCGGSTGIRKFLAFLEESFRSNLLIIYTFAILVLVLLVFLMSSIIALACCHPNKDLKRMRSVQSIESQGRKEGSAYRQGLVKKQGGSGVAPPREIPPRESTEDTLNERFTSWKPEGLQNAPKPPPLPPRNLNTSSGDFSSSEEF